MHFLPVDVKAMKAFACIFLLAALPILGREPAPTDDALDFRLPKRGGNTVVSLRDFQGQIVVLDFFAYWCVPCIKASPELESGIGEYYSARKGNAHGVPVHLFAVNSDTAEPDKTADFIRKTGLKTVLDDADGRVLQRYGGNAFPYLVVVDCTGPKSGAARVIYKHAGFEGLDTLRWVIDSIGGTPIKTGVDTEQLNLGTSPADSVSSATYKTTLDYETLMSDDILLTDTRFELRRSDVKSSISASFSHGYIGLQYVPEFIGVEVPKDIYDNRYTVQLQGRYRAMDQLTLMVGGGGYQGYSDYRSMWLNEHYRQLYSRVPGYEKAHPWGFNVSGGLRLEYWPSRGFIQANVVYQHDVVAPGYEARIFQPLLRQRDKYDTVSFGLSLENVLTKRLRALQEFQITNTTTRELRYSLQSSLNCALGEHYALRLALSGVKEEPVFESWSVGGTLEREWDEKWFVSLFGRYYEDTGEITTSLPGNSAAPLVRTVHAGIGLRWQGQQSAFKFVAGPYSTRYGFPSTTNTSIYSFSKLYRDRDWFSAQLSFSHEF